MAPHSSYQIILNSLLVSLLQLVQSIILSPASLIVKTILVFAHDCLYPQPESPQVKRTNTQHLTTFTRPAPAAVTYDVSEPHAVTITVPPQSTWTSGPHWHEKHTEYLQVVDGLARLMLDGKTRVCGPSDGIIEVRRFVLHEWQREAKGYARADGQERRDLVVREWTMPADGQKEIFFRMLNSYLIESEPQRLHRWLPLPHFLVGWLEQHVVLLQLLVIFKAMDNWPTFDNETERVDWQTWAVTHTYLHFAWQVGKFLGIKGGYEEYVGSDSAKKRNDHKQVSKERTD
jgi:hypothetical protein